MEVCVYTMVVVVVAVISVQYACFFFQAEDGIRDYKVTGVQTCALPILQLDQALHQREADAEAALRAVEAALALHEELEDLGQELGLDAGAVVLDGDGGVAKIGRASCRERV